MILSLPFLDDSRNNSNISGNKWDYQNKTKIMSDKLIINMNPRNLVFTKLNHTSIKKPE